LSISSHGGGPLPILGDASHQAMVNFMLQLPSHLESLMLSWSSAPIGKEAQHTVRRPHPSLVSMIIMVFPDEAYEITYPAPGSPHLANRIAELLHEGNIPAHIDPQRGFDHGLFIR